MKRLLLVTHRASDQAGGPAARWRSFLRHLPELGWDTDVVSAPQRTGAVEFASDERDRRNTELRARVMGAAGRVADPAFARLGVRPEALPLSTAWLLRGSIAVRRRLAGKRYAAIVATGPPMVALLAARAALRSDDPPLVLELRDLWAGNPAFDRGGPLLGALERATVRRAAAVVACTPEAVADLRRRHPHVAERIHEVPNGFEGELLALRRAAAAPGHPLTILHSGTLTIDRPLTPLLRVLRRERYRSAFRLVLHGYVAPAIEEEIASMADGIEIERPAPSGWTDAVARIAGADVTLITQGRGAGDATAVASKVYEYLALGRPVLCVSDGGATEALLRRLGADALCARLESEASIAASLDRLLGGAALSPVAPRRLAPYERRHTAERLVELLDEVAGA